jgi:hypothetical protein
MPAEAAVSEGHSSGLTLVAHRGGAGRESAAAKSPRRPSYLDQGGTTPLVRA